jgi:phosphate transport system protein
MNETRKSFHQQLDDMRAEIVRLASMVTETIPQGTEALLSMDLSLADQVIEHDDVIDSRSIDLEERCYQVLALQQPMAGDLRTIVSTIRMISEVERSGDLVVNICKAMRRIYGHELDPKLRGLIGRMGEQAHRLFRLAIDAYVEQDAPLASALNDIDDDLDQLHADFIQAIFESHRTGGLELQVAVQLALVARFYERIGDHAVNIGEKVRYMVTGWMPEHTGAARMQVREWSTEGLPGSAPPDGTPPA